MYSYYVVRSAGYRVPKLIAMSVTVLQIMQMFAGTFVTAYIYLNLDNCPHVKRSPVYMGLAMYGKQTSGFTFPNSKLQNLNQIAES